MCQFSLHFLTVNINHNKLSNKSQIHFKWHYSWILHHVGSKVDQYISEKHAAPIFMVTIRLRWTANDPPWCSNSGDCHIWNNCGERLNVYIKSIFNKLTPLYRTKEWQPWTNNRSMVHQLQKDTLSCMYLSHKSLLNNLTDVRKVKQTLCWIKDIFLLISVWHSDVI